MANLLYPASTGHNVDDKYSALVEPIHKPGVGTVTPSHPGADFSDAIVQDSLIAIALDKQFNRSRKIYQATLAAVSYPQAASELETALAEIKDAWNLQATKNLIGETSILVSSNISTVAATDGTDIYAQIVADRQKMRENNANPKVIIVSPSTYAKLLKAPEFQRSTFISDQAIADGVVGRIAGLDVFEYENLDAAAVDGATIGGITWATADELEYVIYDPEAFSIVTSVEAVRLVEEPTRFVGVLAQVQIVSGFKLTNPKRALLKYHDASAT